MTEEGHQDTLSRVAAIYAEVLAANQATTLYGQKVLEIRTPDRPYWQKCKAIRPIIDAIEERIGQLDGALRRGCELSLQGIEEDALTTFRVVVWEMAEANEVRGHLRSADSIEQRLLQDS
jgi:hypothetical protein